MQIESVSYSMSPERITTDTFDCLWLIIEPRNNPEPIGAASIQWIDWRLRGKLSRFLKDHPEIGKSPVYFPSSRNLSTPMVGLLSSEELDWSALFRASTGIGAKNIAVFFEQRASAESARHALQKFASSGLAERVTLAFDASTA